MVLRFSCPCGAPYTLADHLAGRTFTCTACGVVLKIGAPATPPAAPPPSSDALAASMEWSSEQRRPSGLGATAEPALRPLDEEERRGASGRQARPAADAPLALADEVEGDADDEDGEDDEDDDRPPARPRRSGSGSDLRTSGSSRLKASSPNLRTSGVTKAGDLRASAAVKGKAKDGGSGTGRKATSGRQRGRGASDDDQPRASRACPVCEAPVAAATAVCPSCGVRLKERSALERMVAGGAWQGPVKGLVLLGLAGAIGYGAWSTMSAEKRPDNRLAPVVKTTPPDRDPPPRPPGDDGQARPTTEGTPAASTEATPAPTTEAASAPTTEAKPPDRRPPDRPSDPPPDAPGDPRPTRPDLADAEVKIVPPGPLEADFVRLRDAPPGPALEEAIATLAGRPGVEQPLLQASASLDRTYRLRVHRARLAAGDAAARRRTIEASLKGDLGVPLVYTVVAALELDPEGLRAPLLALSYDPPDALAGKAWAEAAIERTRPRDGALAALAHAFEHGDEEVQRLLAPALALGGDGAALARCAEALAHPSAPVRALALTGLQAIAAGTGPGGDDPAAWREWIASYAPMRELLMRACAEPADVATAAAARRELLEAARQAIPALPVFMQDRAARTAAAGAAIGDLLALGGQPGDAPALRTVLAALGIDRADQGGVHIIRGALLACDDAVAEEAAAAVIRGAARVEDAAALLPDLLRPAGARTQEALGEWARSLEGPRAAAARLVAAGFRCGWLEPWLLEQSQADRAGRGAVGARLASTKVERALLDALEGKQAPAAFQHVTEVHAALVDLGTETAAERLLKLALADNPPADVLRTLSHLGDARHGRRLKRQVETCADWSQGGAYFDAYARLLGVEAAASLARRAKEEDALKNLARPLLVRLGGPHAREHARRPFEALTGRPDQRVPTMDEVIAFSRAAAPQDAELFKRLLINFDQLLPSTQRQVLLGMGLLGLRDGVMYAEGYVRDGHPERATGAVTLALLGARASAPRLKEVALQGKNPDSHDPSNALIVAALAALSPEDGREVARRYVPACRRRAPEEVTVAVAFALARAEDDEGLRPLVGDPDVRVRAATARGIALAALSRREGIAALPVLEALRHDPAPEVRAEAAVARGLLGLPGAARDIVVALSGRAEHIDVTGRGYGGPTKDGPSHLAYLAATEDLTSLRHALWVAHAACTPGGGAFRPDLGRGRQRELLRDARAKLPK
ncbi:MAG: hypothetical protein M9894_05930 [Planctomycetes bacterium]|nr:hypothetical protein [Planctomycetota bacterium]